jgi:hypothetical protein
MVTTLLITVTDCLKIWLFLILDIIWNQLCNPFHQTLELSANNKLTSNQLESGVLLSFFHIRQRHQQRPTDTNGGNGNGNGGNDSSNSSNSSNSSMNSVVQQQQQ